MPMPARTRRLGASQRNLIAALKKAETKGQPIAFSALRRHIGLSSRAPISQILLVAKSVFARPEYSRLERWFSQPDYGLGHAEGRIAQIAADNYNLSVRQVLWQAGIKNPAKEHLDKARVVIVQARTKRTMELKAGGLRKDDIQKMRGSAQKEAQEAEGRVPKARGAKVHEGLKEAAGLIAKLEESGRATTAELAVLKGWLNRAAPDGEHVSNSIYLQKVIAQAEAILGA